MTRPSPASDPSFAELRAALVAAGRRLGARGLISAGEGNLSIRLADGRLLVTPTGLRKDELTDDDLLVASADPSAAIVGDARGRRPSSDIAIHRAVLAARPDVLAVAHAHLPASMALTVAGHAPDPAALPETALFLPRIPVVPFGAPGSADLAARIATAFAEPPAPLPGAVILERHGAVAVGGPAAAGLAGAAGAAAGTAPGAVTDADRIAALAQAVDRLELVEVLCRTWRDAVLLRAALGQGPPASGR